MVEERDISIRSFIYHCLNPSLQPHPKTLVLGLNVATGTSPGFKPLMQDHSGCDVTPKAPLTISYALKWLYYIFICDNTY